jgi:imidazole glycerol phosphate synthase subunit HisF
MADTEILGARAQQVRIPVLVGGGAKSPEALKVAVRPTTSAPSRPRR